MPIVKVACETGHGDSPKSTQIPGSLSAWAFIVIFGQKHKVMAKLTLEIEDKKLKFFKDLILNFSFVKIDQAELEEATDEQVRENIREGVKELELVLEGKKKPTPFRDFLKELDEF